MPKPSVFAAFSDGPRPLGRRRPSRLARILAAWRDEADSELTALADATRERRPTAAEAALADGPDFEAWEREYSQQNRGRP